MNQRTYQQIIIYLKNKKCASFQIINYFYNQKLYWKNYFDSVKFTKLAEYKVLKLVIWLENY